MTNESNNINIDQEELNKFKQLASSWWDPNGPLKSLHDINPLRLSFMLQHTQLTDQILLDVGCGGGILTEACAQKGAICTGLDANQALIDTAKLHALEHELAIDYRCSTIEAFEPAKLYDIIVCMELLEHVPDPISIITAISKQLKSGGQLFLSTINRTPMAYLQAIIAGEHILKLLPKGTHEYEKFIKPAELRTWCSAADLDLVAMAGMSYNPIRKHYFLTKHTTVNYLAYFQKN